MRFGPGTPLKQNKKLVFGDTPRKINRRINTTASPGGQGEMYTVYSAVSQGAAPEIDGRERGVILGGGVRRPATVRGGPGGGGRSRRADPASRIRLRRHQHGMPGPKGHGGGGRCGPLVRPATRGEDRRGGCLLRGDSRHREDPFGLRDAARLVPRRGEGGFRGGGGARAPPPAHPGTDVFRHGRLGADRAIEAGVPRPHRDRKRGRTEAGGLLADGFGDRMRRRDDRAGRARASLDLLRDPPGCCRRGGERGAGGFGRALARSAQSPPPAPRGGDAPAPRGGRDPGEGEASCLVQPGNSGRLDVSGPPRRGADAGRFPFGRRAILLSDLFQQTLESVSIGILAFDGAGRLTYINPAAEEILHGSSRAFGRKHYRTVFRGSPGAVRILRKALEDNAAVTGYDVELRLPRRSRARDQEPAGGNPRRRPVDDAGGGLRGGAPGGNAADPAGGGEDQRARGEDARDGEDPASVPPLPDPSDPPGGRGTHTPG